MQKQKRMGKRLLALTLALVMALSTVTECLAAVVRQPVAQGDGETVTWGELIADSYDRLTDAEKAILRSGLLKDTVTYTAPGNGDGLITVDSEAKTLTVRTSFEKGGITWTAQSARISYTGGEETVALDASGKGSFAYTGNDYTALADYAATLTMAADAQRQLMKLPRMLVSGWNGMAKIADESYMADLLGANIDSLVTLVNEGIPTPFATVSVDDSNKAPIEELKRQTTDNSGNKLDIVVKVDAYNAAASKVQYLTESGADFRKTAVDYCDTVGVLVDTKVNDNCLLNAVTTMLSAFGGSMTAEQKNKLTTAKTALETLQKSRTAILTALGEWTVLTENVFKAGMTAADYAAMDTMVKAATAEGALTGEALIDNELFGVTEEVRTLTTTVAAQVNRCDVTVQVRANVIPLESRDSAAAETKDYAGAATLTLAAGMSRAEVEAAIAAELAKTDSVEALALAGWTAFGVDGVNYTRELRAEKDYTALTENVTYTVTYTPKEYALDLGDGNGAKQVPYGYNAVLPAYVNQPGEDLSYEYTVGGVGYEQGAVYRVTGDTAFTRAQDTTKTRLTYGVLVADAAGSRLSDAEKTLLRSGALVMNGKTVGVRYPGSNDGLVTVASGYTVTAKESSAKYGGLSWVPVKVTFVGGSLDGTTTALTKNADNTYSVTKSGTELVSVTVEYTLDLSGKIEDLDVAEAMALPGKLAADAAQHRATMASLGGQMKNRMGQITQAQIKTLVNGGDENTDLPQYIKDALKKVADNCFDSDGKLTLYNYVVQYETDGTGGLAYLYQGNRYGTLTAQAQLLYQQLDAALGGSDPAKQAEAETAIKKVMKDFGVGEEKYNTILAIRDELRTVIGSMRPALDAQIDTGKSMTELVGLIDAVGSGTAAPGTVSIVRTANVSASAPGNVQITVKIGDDLTVTKTYRDGYTLTQNDVDTLENEAKAALANKLGADAPFYTEGTLTGVQAGDSANGVAGAKLEYAEKEVTVTVPGAPEQTLKLSSRVITLPAASAGERNDYTITIDGAAVRTTSEATFEFSKEQLQQLLAGKSCVISCTTVQVSDENLRKFIKGANGKINDEALNFLMLENGSGKVDGLILRVGINKGFTTDAITAFGTYLMGDGASLTKIAFGSEVFYEEKISLQALVNTVLNSGMTLESFRDAMTVSGTMVEMTEGGTVAESGVTRDPQLKGAKLLKTDVTLTISGETVTLPLYVTMESFGAGPEKLVSLRKTLTDVLNRAAVSAANGSLNVNGTVPEKAWGYVLAAMLLTGKTTLDDVSALEIKTVVDYLYGEKLKGLYEDPDVDLITVGNTLLKLGVSQETVKKITDRNGLYAKLRSMGVTATDSGSGRNYDVTLAVNVGTALEALVTSETTMNQAKAILRTEENVTVPVKTVVENESDYAAMVVGTKGVQFLSDLRNVTVSDNTSMVVLLKDCAGTLNITGKYVYVDLHGHTLDGKIVGSSQYAMNNFVVDSSLNSSGTGKVTGTVSNMVLAGGTYTGNTSGSTIRNGYTKDGAGLVTNDYYTITANGSNINVTLKATAQALRDADKYTVAALAADIASDLLVNYYSTAQQVTVDGHTLYSITLEDVTTLFQNGAFHVSNAVGNDLLDSTLGYAGGYDGINYMIDSLLEKLLDFGTLAGKIGTGSAAASYALNMTGWDVSAAKADAEDYLKLGVTGNGGNTGALTLNIYLDSDSDSNNEKLKDALEQLDEIVTEKDVSLTLERVSVPAAMGGKTVQVKAGGSGKVTIDMSGDTTYAVMMAVAVANSLPAGSALRGELADAVVWYYTKDDVTPLKTAMEKVTCAQVFAALKTIGLRTNFQTLARQAGITDSATLSAIGSSYGALTAYRGGMAGAGWLLKRLNINGNNVTLGGLKKTGEYGTYEYSKDSYTVDRTVNVRGWQANGVLELSDSRVTLKLFAEDGDIVVTDSTGKRVYNGNTLADAIAKLNEKDGSTMTLNGSVTMTADATILRDVTVVNTDKLTQGAYRFLLSGSGKLTSDAAVTVASADAAHYVVTSGSYVYTLAAYKVKVESGGSTTYYQTLESAMAAAQNNAAITVLDAVTLSGDVSVGAKALTIQGMAKVAMNGKQFILDNAASKLVLDKALDSGDVAIGSLSSYTLNVTTSGAWTTYSLKYTGGNSGGGTVTGNYIYLDVKPSGISASQLQTAVRKYLGDSSATVTVNSGLNASGLVANGAGIQVSGSKGGSYTVIIMGDTNCNGKTDSGDAVKMRNHYFGTAQLSGVALEAADMNRNGKVDAGDAVKNRVKYQNWSGYRSELKITV